MAGIEQITINNLADAARRMADVAAQADTLPDDERRVLMATMRTPDEPPPADPDHRSPLVRMIPKRFDGVRLETYQPSTAEQREALRLTQQWVARVKSGQPAMLALIGQQGTGKSHLLYAAMREILGPPRAPGRMYARPWYRLADELRYGGRSAYNDQTVLEPSEVRAELWGARLVLIDEVRPTASTGFDDTELAKLFCHIYDQEGAAFITTNVNPLEEVMGGPAASRFRSHVVVGPDWRQERPRMLTGRDRAAGDR